ncbi:hypothetical protein PanWU01x14_322750 [Parasponia andersonii]|uniref:Uncharacterized protein n=1 Tax=Parasponia andersonii TaxID=3476 RepID=A0A2P5AKV3_PARAD|nr:hypothetical protein PanWU01x14_322750 [Parasponia andersonii]
MKKRCSKPSTKAPSWIPNLSQPDRNRGKRVRFSDNDVDSAINFQPQRSDEAKTSEFAFFKKLKEDAGQRFTSRLAHNESNQTDDFKSMDTSRENINVVNSSCKEKIRSSSLIANATPLQCISFHPPLVSAGTRNNSDVCMNKTSSTVEDVKQKRNDMEEYSHALRPEGTQYRHAEVFNRKRQKLRRWVTNVSFAEIDGLCSKGSDIVPVLLNRLIPESKDKNNGKDQKLGQVETDAKSLLGASSESDISCNRLQWTPRDFTELECGPYIDDVISYGPWNRSRGRILFLNAPLLQDNKAHHDSGLHKETQALCAEADSSFVFPVRRLRSVELLEDLDDFCQPNRYLIGNQSNTPLLDWDNDNMKVERNSSITSQDLEQNTRPMSLAPRAYDDKVYADGWFSSPHVYNNEEPGCSRPHSCLSSYHNKETQALCTEGDSSFVFPVRRLRSVELLEDLDDFCQPNRYLVGNQSNTPLLDWDNDNDKVERNLSITSQDLEQNTHPMSLAPRVYDDKAYANGLFSSPNVYNNEEPECLRSHSCLSSYHDHERGIQILEGEEDIHISPDSNYVPLTLSRRMNHLSRAEDFYNDTGFPHQDRWHMSRLINQRHPFYQAEALLSSRLVLDLGWKFFSKSDFPEGTDSSSYHALEYPRNQRRSSHYIEHAYDSCLDDSSYE